MTNIYYSIGIDESITDIPCIVFVSEETFKKEWGENYAPSFESIFATPFNEIDEQFQSDLMELQLLQFEDDGIAHCDDDDEEIIIGAMLLEEYKMIKY